MVIKLSDEEKETVVQGRQELSDKLKSAWKEFVQYQDGCCVCWVCFVIWLKAKEEGLLQEMAIDYCWLVSFIEHRGEIREEWGLAGSHTDITL